MYQSYRIGVEEKEVQLRMEVCRQKIEQLVQDKDNWRSLGETSVQLWKHKQVGSDDELHINVPKYFKCFTCVSIAWDSIAWHWNKNKHVWLSLCNYAG